MYLKTENVTGSTKRSAVWARWKTLDTPEAIRKGIRTQLKEQSSYAFAFGGYSRKIILRQTLSSLYRLSLSTLRSASIDKSVYLIQNGADRFSFIFFRGFGTGAMHVLCGLIVGGGLAYMAADVAEGGRHVRAAGRGHHPSTPSIICSSPTAARRSTSPTPCRCCWWRREGCLLSDCHG